ncbi:MAG: hypothetical protein ACLQCU_09930 [Acidimicrobiales bacterium]
MKLRRSVTYVGRVRAVRHGDHAPDRAKAIARALRPITDLDMSGDALAAAEESVEFPDLP